MNKKIILKQRPVGEPKLEDFELLEEEIRNPEDDEVLLKTIYMSLDPVSYTHLTLPTIQPV